MSSSERRWILGALAAGGCAVLSGCFKPMLARDSTASALRHRIALPAVDGRFGYFLNESLTDQLGKPHAPDLRLEVRSDISERGIAIAQDNSVTRITLSVAAEWSVWQIGDDQPVLSETTGLQSGYNATTSLYATRQTRLDIERRLARTLGERIGRSILALADRFA